MQRYRKLTPTVLALAVLILAAVGAQAETRDYDETLSAKSDGTVTVENIAGSIEIQGWDQDKVQASGTLGDDVKDVEFTSKGRTTRLKVVYPKHSRNIDEGAKLVIKVPRGSRIEVECVSAPITVSGIEGQIDATTVSGDVTVDGGGDEVRASSVSGDVKVDSQASEVKVKTVSGTVVARGGKADVEASVVSGGIDLRFDQYRDCSVETVSGDAKVAGDFSDDSDCEINVHSGDITLIVPADLAADFEVETFSGDIDNDFGQKARRTSKYTPGRELEFSVNGGGARIRINSFSGTVDIRKK